MSLFFGVVLVLAHPLVEPGGLPVPPVVLATVAVCVVALLARVRGAGARADLPQAAVSTTAASTAVARPLVGPVDVGLRVLGVVLLVLAILAGRLGRNSDLANIAPALVVGVGWPGLVLLAAAFGRVWRRIDPWDSLARVLGALAGTERSADHTEPEDPRGAPPDPRPAAVAALAWMWYLHVHRQPLEPRSVGAALAAYTLVMLTGCLLVGRPSWLARTEVFGLFYGWVGELRRRRGWSPPAGAAWPLGVLTGGLLFGGIRESTLWGGLAFSPFEWWYTVAGLLAACLLGALLVDRLEAVAARLRAPGSVVAAAVVMTGAVVVAVALTRNRLFVSVQVLAALASDPLGRGWDLFGTADVALAPAPLGGQGLVAVQVGVLLGAALVAVRVGRRRSPGRRAAGPSLGLACSVLAAGIMTLTVA